MRSYRIAESVAARARGVIRIERLDYPATISSPGRPAGEFTASLDEVLASEHVHLYRQLMRPDGTTREYLIDVDGTGLGFVEALDPPASRAGPGSSLHPGARNDALGARPGVSPGPLPCRLPGPARLASLCP